MQACTFHKSNKKTFDCELCFKKFSSNTHLKTHKSDVHDERRNHKCEQCDKSFKRASHLRGHTSRTHQKKKEFSCDICSKFFFKKEDLTRHLKRRTHIEKVEQDKPLNTKATVNSLNFRNQENKNLEMPESDSNRNAAKRKAERRTKSGHRVERKTASPDQRRSSRTAPNTQGRV